MLLMLVSGTMESWQSWQASSAKLDSSMGWNLHDAERKELDWHYILRMSVCFPGTRPAFPYPKIQWIWRCIREPCTRSETSRRPSRRRRESAGIRGTIAIIDFSPFPEAWLKGSNLNWRVRHPWKIFSRPPDLHPGFSREMISRLFEKAGLKQDYYEDNVLQGRFYGRPVQMFLSTSIVRKL